MIALDGEREIKLFPGDEALCHKPQRPVARCGPGSAENGGSDGHVQKKKKNHSIYKFTKGSDNMAKGSSDAEAGPDDDGGHGFNWLKKGDAVKESEPLFEVETDK